MCESIATPLAFLGEIATAVGCHGLPYDFHLVSKVFEPRTKWGLRRSGGLRAQTTINSGNLYAHRDMGDGSMLFPRPFPPYPHESPIYSYLTSDGVGR